MWLIIWHCSDLWLEVPSESSGDDEQLYYLVLLDLFSLLTHYVDTDPEESGVIVGVCKYMLSKLIQVRYIDDVDTMKSDIYEVDLTFKI